MPSKLLSCIGFLYKVVQKIGFFSVFVFSIFFPFNFRTAKALVLKSGPLSLYHLFSNILLAIFDSFFRSRVIHRRRSFFLTVIQPDLEYSAVACIPNMPEFQKQRLLTLWRKAVRCVAGAERHADVDPICKELSLTPLDHRWALKFAMLVRRCYMNQAPAAAVMQEIKANVSHIARLVGTTCIYTRLNLRLSLVSYHFQIDLPSYGMLFSLCPTYAPCPCQNLKRCSQSLFEF